MKTVVAVSTHVNFEAIIFCNYRYYESPEIEKFNKTIQDSNSKPPRDESLCSEGGLFLKGCCEDVAMFKIDKNN